MPSLRILALGTLTTISVAIYCFYRYKNIWRKSQKLPKELIYSPKSRDGSQSEISNITNRGRISEDEIEYLVSLLSSANTTKFIKIMKTLINFTNFNENMPAFRKTSSLNVLLSNISLGGDGDFLRTVNIHIINLFSNLVVDDCIRQFINVNINRFFEVDLPSLSEEELVATLRLFANLALLPEGCDSIANNVQYIYKLIAMPNTNVSRQVWTVLLNISCDYPSIPTILSATIVPGVGEIMTDLAFQNENGALCEKVTKFLGNLYTYIATNRTILRIHNASLAEELMAIKENVELQASLFLTSASTLDSVSVFSETKKLTEILEKL